MLTPAPLGNVIWAVLDLLQSLFRGGQIDFEPSKAMHDVKHMRGSTSWFVSDIIVR
jgi:hypothetical protein